MLPRTLRRSLAGWPVHGLAGHKGLFSPCDAEVHLPRQCLVCNMLATAVMSMLGRDAWDSIFRGAEFAIDLGLAAWAQWLRETAGYVVSFTAASIRNGRTRFFPRRARLPLQ